MLKTKTNCKTISVKSKNRGQHTVVLNLFS